MKRIPGDLRLALTESIEVTGMASRENEILLESGTNEVEILEFRIKENSFGINIAKVRELLQYCPVQSVPHSQNCVEGVICPRDEILTVIDLASYLKYPAEDHQDQGIFIITEFNQSKAAFHVHQVMGIHRISWSAIEKPNGAIFGGEEGAVTGIAKLEKTLISILDFEKIMVDISPDTSVLANAASIASSGTADSKHKILVAEDSMVLRKVLLESLNKAGYSNVVVKDNGQDAWDYLRMPGHEVSCVITDIEMPKMDGHHLTKRIKESKDLKHIPVMLFSSLITEEMFLKGKEIGADVQLSKPDIHILVESLNELIKKI